MPSAPKCKICGKAHWSGQPCVFAAAPPPKVPKLRATPRSKQKPDEPPPGFGAPIFADDHLAAENTRLRARIAELEAQLAALTKPLKAPKAAAYMREYRAKKRAVN